MEKQLPPSEKIHLVGPDGWRFTVDRSVDVGPTQNVFDTPPNPESLVSTELPLALQRETTTAQLTESTETKDSGFLDSPAVLAGGALALTAAGVAAARMFRNPTRYEGNPNEPRRQRAANRRVADRDAHSTAARDSLGRMPTDPYFSNPDKALDRPFNRINAFENTHRQRRLASPIQAGGSGGFEPEAASESRTITQERAAMRANLREDAINERVSVADRYLQVYGDSLLSRQDTNDYISHNRVPKKEARAMKRAGRIVRRRLKSEGRIRGRLKRQADQRDIHGIKNRAISRIMRDN